jgi:hypothetical protein
MRKMLGDIVILRFCFAGCIPVNKVKERADILKLHFNGAGNGDLQQFPL